MDLRRVAEETRKDPGRFNTKDVGALYLSLQPETAIAELRKNLERDGKSPDEEKPWALFTVVVALERVVDLTVAETLASWELTRADLSSEKMTATQRAAARMVEQGCEAVLWPSAAGSGESLAIFMSHLTSGSRVSLARSRDLSLRS